MLNHIQRKLLRIFKILVWSLAAIVIGAYTFSIKFLGVVIFSSAAVFVISKLSWIALILGLVILFIFVLQRTKP